MFGFVSGKLVVIDGFFYYIDYNIKKLRTERISKNTDICSRLYINFFFV